MKYIHVLTQVINQLLKGWSDFRSASSVERIEAFIKLGRPDPVVYGENGEIVEWGSS